MVGGFYRVHADRSVDENLNAPGAKFVPLAFEQSNYLPQPGVKPGASAPNRFYMYGVVARLAMAAASYELEAVSYTHLDVYKRQVHSLRRGVAEALEIVARGDRKSSRVVGRKVSELQLPREVHIGLIVRGLPELPDTPTEGLPEPEVIIPRSATVIESNDHVGFFLPHKRLGRDVEDVYKRQTPS